MLNMCLRLSGKAIQKGNGPEMNLTVGNVVQWQQLVLWIVYLVGFQGYIYKNIELCNPWTLFCIQEIWNQGSSLVEPDR